MHPPHFYVYAHLRRDGTPFYVGKGSGRRAYKAYKRSLWWQALTSREYPDGSFPTTLILSASLSRDDAFTIERFWIAAWGRRDMTEWGILVNMTDGGEGGHNLSPDTRKRISQALSGSTSPFHGRTLSAVTRRRISQSLSGEKHPQFGQRGAGTYRFGQTVGTLGRLAMSQAKVAPIYLSDPSGTVWVVQNRTAFARLHGLSARKLNRMGAGTARSHRGWSIVLSPSLSS